MCKIMGPVGSLALAVVFILVFGFFMLRHILSALLMLELGLLFGLLILGDLCPVSWESLVVVLLTMGVGEAGLGLSVVVKLSRGCSNDRISLSSL
nr:NADH dehydrogenase subunit 4L [Hydroides norvegica]